MSVRAKFQERIVITCTGCRYCMSCASTVNIPVCFALYNQSFMFGTNEQSTQHYNLFDSGFFDGIPSFASCCTERGTCEVMCPQGLPIRGTPEKCCPVSWEINGSNTGDIKKISTGRSSILFVHQVLKERSNLRRFTPPFTSINI
ncbi:MAG: hypothetical protein WCF90_07375 [Methanomicrobiales archaeon]